MQPPNSKDVDVERYRRARQIFDRVVDLPLAGRADELARECVGDGELRAFVEALLASDEQADVADLSLTPILNLADFAGDLDLTGRTLGRYRIVGRLGSGGMGTVYEALQAKPHRSVALKVMRHVVASPAARRRFEYEVEILSRLRHPGIAHVYEAGVLEIHGQGVPYFAMELVAHARTVDEFADARDLTTRQRVELFVKVCDAVQHGHQNGVIHRDLKPANILVDEAGEPKLIDFGVARSTNSDVTFSTQLGQLLGTLAYMSPEQCEADPKAIDTRSDVYSLGVVLYELLCGSPPYDLTDLTLPAATQVIQTRPPQRPSTRRIHLKGDLDAILLKALHKNREQRYDSAAALAADLRHFLAGRPIDARLPSAWTRGLGWSRRHPVVTTSALCVVMLATSFTSILAGERLASEPDRVVIDPTGRYAYLESRTGRRIHTWSVGEAVDVRIAELASAPDSLGGGRIALVGARRSPIAGEVNGEVSAYDVEHPERVLWSTTSAPLVPPAGSPTDSADVFDLMCAFTADALAESDGQELVVVQFSSDYDATAIRVFDLGGRLRYEAWHFGHVHEAFWLEGSKRLLLGGYESQWRWDQRLDEGEVAPGTYPLVLFALNVRDGRTGAPTWIERDGQVHDDTLAWYRWLGPAQALAGWENVSFELTRDVGALDRSRTVRFEARGWSGAWKGSYDVAFFIDADGREVGRIVSDEHKHAERDGLVKDAQQLRWLDYAELPVPPSAVGATPGASAVPDDRR